MTESISPTAPFVLLHTDDNVLVCRAKASAGDSFLVDGAPLVIASTIEVGHKAARHDLKSGDKIIKYGAPIGSMTQDAAKGSHIHMHNMKSDYIPSHTRGTVS